MHIFNRRKCCSSAGLKGPFKNLYVRVTRFVAYRKTCRSDVPADLESSRLTLEPCQHEDRQQPRGCLCRRPSKDHSKCFMARAIQFVAHRKRWQSIGHDLEASRLRLSTSFTLKTKIFIHNHRDLHWVQSYDEI
jgi:hypothetical protein